MKKYFLICFFFMLNVSLSYAVPNLQVGVEDGYYDVSTETVMIDKDIFTFYALSDGNVGNYYLAISLVPVPGNITDVGDFSILPGAGVSAGLTLSNWMYGTPSDLPTHSIFPTWYKEIVFQYSGNSKAKSYNVEDNPDGWQAGTGLASDLFSAEFTIDMSGISDEYSLHIDLYSYVTKNNVGTQIKFSPNSHDGQGNGGDPVPEPATMLLFGTGIAGLAGIARRKRD